MDKPLERSLSIINDKPLERSLSIVVGGYLIALGFYFIWCFYSFYERLNIGNYLLVVVAVVFAITAVYFFSYLLILHIKSLQKVRTSFFLISIISLLVFFLIPPVNSKIYYNFHDIKLNLNQDKPSKSIDKNEPEIKILAANKKEIKKQFEDANKKGHTGQKRMKVIESKLDNAIVINDSAKKTITELQAKLEAERKENDKLRKQLNEITRKTKSLEEEHKTKEYVIIHVKSKKDFSEIKNQEIIFKVQIISSSTRLATNSPKFKGLKNVWEYKDNGLYKYAVGNQKDLKSASALQSEFRRNGFDGAFVVAFKNGKRIPVREAINFLN
jgi:uncharacterized coiled-coil protein SlyX